ncbi:hypothetical protein [Halosimplex halobium]|uniref:hypothetical protein n=1 Tax=Halosimplex halobium TaxID=3396618 RepID=UPI003F5530C2
MRSNLYQFLGQVNVFNETDRRLAGSVAVAGPDGESRLDETFELISSRTDTGDGQPFATHDDVWDGSGAYEVTVDMADDVDSQSRVTETVEIDTPDEQRLAVVVGGAGVDDPVDFRVGESLSEFVPTATTETTS